MSGMFDISDLVWGALNYFKDTLATNSGDPRRDSSRDFINAALMKTYGRDTLESVTGFYGIVMAAIDTYQVDQADKPSLLTDYAQSPSDSTTGLRTAYKVYIPEMEPSPTPMSQTDAVLWFYPNMFPTTALQKSTALSPGDLVRVEYRDLQNLIEPTIVSLEGHIPLAFPSTKATGLPFKFKATPAIEGYQRVETHTTVPKAAALGATEFYNRLRASIWFKDYSREFLIGLTANANNESGFVENITGDPRAAGTGDRGIEVNGRAWCSFGYWQMNVCGAGFGGDKFAQHFNINVLDKENRTAEGELFKAITTEEKQFEFLSVLLEQKRVKYHPQTAVEWARILAVEFERCHACADLGAGRDSQTRARMNVAAGLESKIGADTGWTDPGRAASDGQGISSTSAPENESAQGYEEVVDEPAYP